MRRDVADDLSSVLNAPSGFMEQARLAIELIPDEWDVVHVSPQFVLKENGFPVEPIQYVGARWIFLKGEKYVASMTEDPGDLMEDQLRETVLEHVRHAFEQAGVR